MLRIGEFAELSAISINMLRNYDKIGLLVPEYIDQSSGYRYYDKEQLVQANQILALKSMGFGLDDIRKFVLQPDADINEYLQEKLQDKYVELEKVKNQIIQIKSVMNNDQNIEEYALKIVRKEMPAMWVVSLCGQIDTYQQEGIMWKKLSDACEWNHIRIFTDSPAIAFYNGMDEKSGKLLVEVRFPLDKKYIVDDDSVKIFRTPDCEVVSVVFKGRYLQISSINTVVAEWLENNKLEIDGQAFTIYHKSPGNCSDDKSFITELCFPIKEKV